MTNFIYLLGPAGCGKSTLADALATLLSGQVKCIALNLDPGAEWLPYTPEIDIRARLSLQEVMQRYRLGPNGALVVSVDLMVNHLPELKELVDARNPDYVLVDTPGQMELFAFRETGARIVKGLGEKALILFLIDSFFARRASDFASMLMLATSVYSRFALPQLNVLTKVDAAEPELLQRVERWTADYETLADDLQLEAHELRRQASGEFIDAVRRLGFVGEVHPVSAFEHKGLVELYGAVQRTLGTEAELDLGREEEPYF
jgi:GTPase SAR1 family protein